MNIFFILESDDEDEIGQDPSDIDFLKKKPIPEAKPLDVSSYYSYSVKDF